MYKKSVRGRIITKNIAVSITVLRAFIKSNSIVVQPDSQSGISHNVFVCVVYFGAYKCWNACQKAFYCGMWGVFWRQLSIIFLVCLMHLFWELPLFEGQVLRAYFMDLKLCCIFGKEQNSATACHVSAFNVCISSHFARFRTSGLWKKQDHVPNYKPISGLFIS